MYQFYIIYENIKEYEMADYTNKLFNPFKTFLLIY